MADCAVALEGLCLRMAPPESLDATKLAHAFVTLATPRRRVSSHRAREPKRSVRDHASRPAPRAAWSNARSASQTRTWKEWQSIPVSSSHSCATNDCPGWPPRARPSITGELGKGDLPVRPPSRQSHDQHGTMLHRQHRAPTRPQSHRTLTPARTAIREAATTEPLELGSLSKRCLCPRVDRAAGLSLYVAADRSVGRDRTAGLPLIRKSDS
jgi:hypothetical protein